jgi:hypothetical protein
MRHKKKMFLALCTKWTFKEWPKSVMESKRLTWPSPQWDGATHRLCVAGNTSYKVFWKEVGIVQSAVLYLREGVAASFSKVIS